MNNDLVKSITRSGTTFTAKNSAGTQLFTFTQQDNNTTTGTTYSAGSAPANTTFGTNGSIKNVFDRLNTYTIRYTSYQTGESLLSVITSNKGCIITGTGIYTDAPDTSTEYSFICFGQADSSSIVRAMVILSKYGQSSYIYQRAIFNNNWNGNWSQIN